MVYGQYKRIYNILFVLLFICTCIFVYGASKDWITHLTNKSEENLYNIDPGSSFVLQKVNVAERMIDFSKNNLEFLSGILTLIAYTSVYFLVWYLTCLCVRYVKAGKK